MLSIYGRINSRLIRLDDENGFLSNVPVDHLKYMIRPRKYRYRHEVWLLLTAVTGLINADEKWKMK